MYCADRPGASLPSVDVGNAVFASSRGAVAAAAEYRGDASNALLAVEKPLPIPSFEVARERLETGWGNISAGTTVNFRRQADATEEEKMKRGIRCCVCPSSPFSSLPFFPFFLPSFSFVFSFSFFVSVCVRGGCSLVAVQCCSDLEKITVQRQRRERGADAHQQQQFKGREEEKRREEKTTRGQTNTSKKGRQTHTHTHAHRGRKEVKKDIKDTRAVVRAATRHFLLQDESSKSTYDCRLA
jgi:hypothetical protein